MNREIFNTLTQQAPLPEPLPEPLVLNEAGGAAYALSNMEALAQLACTGTFNDTFYEGGAEQFTKVLELCEQVPPRFIAQCAIYAHQQGKMKDMPALLLAIVASKDVTLFPMLFATVVGGNPKMLRNFVQIIRSGVLGRRSFGYRPKKEIQQWFQERDPLTLLKCSVGGSPTLGDIIKMTHPKPLYPSQGAMFGYLCGREYNIELLTQPVREYILATQGGAITDDVLKLPHRLLTNLELSAQDWRTIALNSGWTAQRMNLNTFARHGVFEGPMGDFTAERLAEKLADPVRVRNSGCFPYQLLQAFKSVDGGVPQVVKAALENALDTACYNVPEMDGRMAVLVDTSYSMTQAITGNRRGSTSATSCVDVAALVASAFLKKNQGNCEVVPFDTRVHGAMLQAGAPVMANAQKLADLGGGGTDIGCAIAHLNSIGHTGELVILVSDNESWFTGDQASYRSNYYNSGTSPTQEWVAYKARNPTAKLVCIDIQPYSTTQVATDKDVLNIGGFSDSVFEAIKSFVDSDGEESWIKLIETQVGSLV